MPSHSAAWAIYREALAPLKYGDALWEPSPIYSYRRVSLGDVGYIREGRFHLLFSAGIPLGERELGTDVPLTFEPLDTGPILRRIRPKGHLHTSASRRIGADVGSSVAVAYAVESGARVAFELTSKQGAALITKNLTRREDIERARRFVTYTKKHYESWVDFAREYDHPEDVRPILVTGVDLTQEFATVAYSDNQTHMECEFSAALPGAGSASVSLWGSWQTTGLVHTNCGPHPPWESSNLSESSAPEPPEPETQEEYTQCVFIRYYTIRKRLWIPIVLKAGAGPHQLPEGDHDDDNSGEEGLQVFSVGDPTELDYAETGSPRDALDEVIHNVSGDDRDSFDVVAEFIFQRSDANSVLLHHDDIQEFLRGDEEELTQLLAESGIAERIEVDENGVGHLCSPPSAGSPKSISSGSKTGEDIHHQIFPVGTAPAPSVTREDISSEASKTQQQKRRDGILSSSDMAIDGLNLAEDASGVAPAQSLVPAPSIPGESPPSAPRACFGRDELIEEVVGYAVNLSPIALIGAGGIGKTSIVLAVLHHHHIKQRFGENRRFIRCDQFPATSAHLLKRLSKVTGAGIENPEDLASLYPFLSSREIFIVLDNAESILDPEGTNAEKIHWLVGELSRLKTISLCITSRISTIPPECKTLDIPALSIDAAQDTFYRMYKKREQSNLIIQILEQLDFHPLSITLLATVAHQNKWDTERLTKEWGTRRTSTLQTERGGSLAATIELSLSSPLFQKLSPDARALLGIVAFFPQGIKETDVDRLFPAISDGTNILDNFCILSLTYRSNGFITMLAPFRDYLSPKDPKSSSLLCTVKEYYFARLSVDIDPNEPDFVESRWITSEDVNVEHLLDVFTTIDVDSADVWEACTNFMKHLYWHKQRLVILNPKIEGLPEDHPSKPKCLWGISRLFGSVGNRVEQKRLLTHALMLSRECGDDRDVAEMLGDLSDSNLMMGLYDEGIQRGREALEIWESLNYTKGLVDCLIRLAWLLHEDKQLDAAEETASRAINLSEEEDQFQLCQSHCALGDVYRSKGEIEKAIRHYEAVLGIARSMNRHEPLFWAHYGLGELFRHEGRFDDANAHVDHARSFVGNNTYNLGRVMHLQADVWYHQGRLEEARSEALRATEVYEKLGAKGSRVVQRTPPVY